MEEEAITDEFVHGTLIRPKGVQQNMKSTGSSDFWTFLVFIYH